MSEHTNQQKDRQTDCLLIVTKAQCPNAIYFFISGQNLKTNRFLDSRAHGWGFKDILSAM